ncbi:ATP-binding protein [Actinomadura madurae]|uniref:Histidine kinase-like ATPase domain-containing protein n=2 Tax=Thermomonosporaceae TaxID=2012 RepID=A0A1I5U9N9_9ACTN|nr:Histidine kinase-like ATPase domain-containing protein [Actinomadura madurae]SPT51950.1 Histidine kinase-, DNA gyrase B-, and HSP90-like ATPase [Actinomadura madurae]
MERLGEPFGFTGDGDGGRRARRLVRERAAKVVADDTLLDDVELMAAEAVANAILHGSGLVTVDVATDGERLRVEIADDGPAQSDPHRRPRLDHGRGLTVIDALADEWGLDQTTRRTRLWFVVDAHRTPADA